jgi:hypothetical protein
MERVTD